MNIRETKIIRKVATVGSQEVLSVSANYAAERGVDLSVTLFDKPYCDAHREEVQAFVSAVIAQVNALLDAEQLPLLLAQRN